mgnify:CR=1 FL=1
MIFYIIIALLIALVALIIIVNVNNRDKRQKKIKNNIEEKGKVIQAEEDYQKDIRKAKFSKFFRYLIAYAFLSIMALLVVFPFYWMFATSVKSAEEVMRIPPTLFPQKIHLENFSLAMHQANFGRYMINTLIVGVVSTLGTIITTVCSAFAFARLNFKGRDLLFAFFIATMMIPGEMMVITNYITVCTRYHIGNWKFTLENTYAAMILPFWVSTYYIFLLRNTFKQIPNELYYAAKVDGTSDLKYLLKVMLPIASPTIITITILKMMGAWNSYVWPNLVTNGDMRLITNGLRSAFSSEDGTTTHLKMAATTVVTVPLLLVFVFFRKYIMKGVSRSGIKG